MMQTRSSREGAALIVVLWTLLVLSMLVASFAFDMHVEGGVASFYRKRMKAQYLAQAGVEYAKFLLSQSSKVDEETVGADDAEEAFLTGVVNLSRGVPITGLSQDLGEGSFSVDIIPEKGRRNVNTLTDEDWEEILDQANVPQIRWDEMIDAFQDWIDENDLHLINGAESDDSFYVDRNYEVKNAPLDTVTELLLVKGFEHEILFGGEIDTGDQVTGIASWLTTWDDGRVNINTASREVLLTLPGVEEWMIDELLALRLGEDGEAGTRDDGFESVDDAMAAITGSGMDAGALSGKLAVKDVNYVRVISRGIIGNVESGIWAVLRIGDQEVETIFWREEVMQ